MAAPADDGLQDLVAILAGDAGASGDRRFQNRSWEHASHARQSAALQREAVKRQRTQEQLDESRTTLAAAVHVQPALARTLGIARGTARKGSLLTDLHQVELALRVALLPARAARGGDSSAQARAAHRVARALQSVQRDIASQWLAQPWEAGAAFRVAFYSHEWDETQQLMKLPAIASRMACSSTSLKAPLQQAKVQVLLAYGHMGVYMWQRGAIDPDIVSGPWLMRPLMLRQQAAADIVEALVRSCPINLVSNADMDMLGKSADVVVLVFTRDGASANTAALATLFSELSSRTTQHVLFSSHVCLLHRVALARGRCRDLREAAATLQSLGRWLRFSRNSAALADVLAQIVASDLIVVRAARPQQCAEQASELLDLLYRGQCETAAFRAAVVEYLCVVEFASAGAGGMEQHGRLVHYCWITGDSSEHTKYGKPVGAACCTCREEAVEKVLPAVINMILGRGWPQLVLSRWTNCGSALRRGLLCCLGPRLLPRALTALRQKWGLSRGGAEEELKATMGEDGDTAVQVENQLRLLRVAKALADPKGLAMMGIAVLTTSPLDDIMYGLLGQHGVSLTLYEAMQPRSSVITMAQRRLCDLISTFGTADWTPATVAGVSDMPRDREYLMLARSQLLQISVGIFEHLEMRLRKAPYTLALLVMNVDEHLQSEVVQAFFSEPEQCLPLWLQRLRMLFPTPAQFKASCRQVIKAWSDQLRLSVGKCERGHAAMRADLWSAGRGKSGTVAANRRLVREAAVAHEDARRRR
jgi:hypothetical protein